MSTLLFEGPTELLDRAKLPETTWELVDPETAQKWLEFNEKNRKVRVSTVDMYARDLRAGRWMVTGDPLRFDHTGRLIDGQHRLRAVVKANMAAWFLVVRGVEPEVQRVLDTQARRTAAEALRLSGFERNTHLVAGIARSALVYTKFLNNEECPVYSSAPAASHSEVEAWVRDHPEISEAAVMANLLNKAAGNGVVAWGLSWTKLMGIDPVMARYFFETTANFKTEGKGDPRFALLTYDPVGKTRGRLGMGEMLIAISTAWNYYRRGENLDVIRTRVNRKYRNIPVAV